jgi:hypothetical protein
MFNYKKYEISNKIIRNYHSRLKTLTVTTLTLNEDYPITQIIIKLTHTERLING